MSICCLSKVSCSCLSDKQSDRELDSPSDPKDQQEFLFQLTRFECLFLIK